jgi:hypothetical protein
MMARMILKKTWTTSVVDYDCIPVHSFDMGKSK